MRRSLSLFDVVCIGLNAIVGSGIFVLPDDLARDMGSLSPLAFLLCAVGLLPVALCYAEAASKVDRTGGPYVYAREAFGPGVGFAVGWMCVANSMFSFAAVASAAAAYAGRIWPRLSGAAWPKLVALVIVFTFAALNYRGARPGARAVNTFTFAKFAVLFTLVFALVPHLSLAQHSAELPRGLAGVSAATFAALFAAQGFEVVPVPAGETRDPERAMPRAIVGSLLAASLVYVVVQTVLVLSYPKLSAPSDAPLADAALAVVPGLAFLVLCGGLVSTLGFVSGSALGIPRYLYAMGVDGLLPRGLAAVHPRFDSPYRAVVVTALVVSGLVAAFDYRALLGMSNVSVAVQYLSTCLAVLALRRRGGLAGRVGSYAVPLLGSLVSLWIFTEASGQELVWALGSLFVGGLVLSALRIRV
ncbi:MAG: APC family permease [Myxococcales bacterium]